MANVSVQMVTTRSSAIVRRCFDGFSKALHSLQVPAHSLITMQKTLECLIRDSM